MEVMLNTSSSLNIEIIIIIIIIIICRWQEQHYFSTSSDVFRFVVKHIMLTFSYDLYPLTSHFNTRVGIIFLYLL